MGVPESNNTQVRSSVTPKDEKNSLKHSNNRLIRSQETTKNTNMKPFKRANYQENDINDLPGEKDSKNSIIIIGGSDRSRSNYKRPNPEVKP
jgi:hypothetical protein